MPDRPVTWDEAKKHLRLDVDTDQAYVESLIDAATDYAEESLSATLMQRERTVVFYAGEQTFALPKGPLVSVTSITDDADNIITDYTVTHVGNSDRLTINASYRFPLTVVYQAGSGTAPSIRLAILQHVATLYENRESVSDKAKLPVPHTLEAFYRLKRRSVPVG